MPEPMRRRVWRWHPWAAWAAGLLVTLGASSIVAAPQPVLVPSLDHRDGIPIPLTGYWFAAASDHPAPAIVLLHGCGGLHDRSGALAERERRYATLLSGMGVHVLVLDSLTARGERELCTQKAGTRRVTQLNRRRDALGALAWLADQPRVDRDRIGMMGFSNGGSTVLAAMNRRHPEVARAPVVAAFAVAFYPGCQAEVERGLIGTGPLLLLLGELDDWTPAEPCRELAAAARDVEIETYPGAHHGFDSRSPVRHRPEVPNGARPGQGVHAGGQLAAREASQRRMLNFVRLHARPGT